MQHQASMAWAREDKEEVEEAFSINMLVLVQRENGELVGS
jgi:hypothetical protein